MIVPLIFWKEFVKRVNSYQEVHDEYGLKVDIGNIKKTWDGKGGSYALP